MINKVVDAFFCDLGIAKKHLSALSQLTKGNANPSEVGWQFLYSLPPFSSN